MIINGTTSSYCMVKDIKISGTIAYIKLLIISNTPQSEHCAFSFWLQDLDTKLFSKADNNIYWIDRCNNYNNDSRNIDINMYKEIIIPVDISNFSTSSMQLNRWIRHVSLVIRPYENGNSGVANWVSEPIELLSQEITLPTITEPSIKNEAGVITVSFDKNYETQEDFNYIDKHLIFKIKVSSVYTSEILEEHILPNHSYKETETLKLINTNYTEPINIGVYVYNNKEELLDYKIRFYNPEQLDIKLKVLNKTFNPVKRIAIKQNGVIKEIIKTN